MHAGHVTEQKLLILRGSDASRFVMIIQLYTAMGWEEEEESRCAYQF